MSVLRIATRYAKSLLDLAIEQGKLEQVYEDMSALKAAAQVRELHLLLKSPVIHADKKLSILNTLFSGKIDSLTMSYLQLLVNKGREGYIADITTAFIHQYKVLKHITAIKVTTAVPLSEALNEQLRKQILASGVTSENLEIDVQVDPSLVGGFVLEFDNKRYDASVVHKLDQLRAQFSKNLYIREI